MSFISRGAYRTWQVWHALRAGPLRAEARSQVSDVLTADQLALFEAQSAVGQQHGYRVMRALKDEGHDQEDLLTAALLHDVAKDQAGYTFLDRVKVVVAQRFTPGLARKWSAGPQHGWTRAFVIKAYHPAWGAEALAAAGGSELSVALVRRHQETPLAPGADDEENRLLALLQWADDQN